MIQALSLYPTAYLMGDLKQDSSIAKQLSVLQSGMLVRIPTLQSFLKDYVKYHT